MGIAFLKGHGTQNDFVVLPDPDAELELTTERVRALCDRRRGLGADGVLRVVRRAALGDTVPESAGEWFMDYRNADGSVAEMCGNGIRLFARYLVRAGLVAGAAGEGTGEFVVGTRAGDRPVRVHPDGTVTVSMGPVRVTGESMVSVGGLALPGVAVDVGNPHLVCRVDTDIAELDLRQEPAYDARHFPRGVNLEFLNELGDESIRMRVHERGVGETRACGTGTVAAAVVSLHAAGVWEGTRTVHVPGGTVTVTIGTTDASLTGPAVLLASGELDEGWWASPA
ncbi:diaminopimelate epimerase [Haloechinothrix sp. LS1_15]|uniref:diaminopimelate epimerase n=1 Tax=Haloechinothrix sp. LS1_15 TaxID=2652248 RepID=UPI0029454B68|nr:diaminopimelate epimerase [Haloechinothrix sp. LS1_15]MDV6014491.1 diaminopimelate epimerase [Haloechinothrix sp. LS1_15]